MLMIGISILIVLLNVVSLLPSSRNELGINDLLVMLCVLDGVWLFCLAAQIPFGKTGED